MKKVVVTSLIALCMISTQVNANIFQDYVPNILAGINLSGIAGDIDADMGLGFQVGTAHDVVINNIPVELSVKAINRNSNYEETQVYYNQTVSTKADMSRTNIEVAAKAKINVSESVTAFVGPYAGFPLIQNTEVEATAMGQTMEMDTDDAFEGLDMGLLFGGSMLLEGFNVQAGYQLGLTDVADGDAKTTGFTFSVGKSL